MDPEEPDNSHLEEWQKYNGGAGADHQDRPIMHTEHGSTPSPHPQDENPMELDTSGVHDAEHTVLLVDTIAANQGSSPPVPIPGAGSNSTADPNRGHNRTQTPNEAPTVANGHEGPITPRNDAGPWVFDGGASRPGPSGSHGGVASLDGALDVD